MVKFEKPSQVWKYAAKNLKQGTNNLYYNGAYCALGAIGKLGLGFDDNKLENTGDYEAIRKWDNLSGLASDLVEIYRDLDSLGRHGKIVAERIVYLLNDVECWSFEDFATVAEMLGY